MCHRPSPKSGCRPARKPSGACSKPIGRHETLADLIREYKREYGDHQRARRRQFRDFASITEAIKHATGSVGKVPDHQRRVGREALTRASDQLLRHQEEIESCETFAEILALVEASTAGVRRFGRLAVYDTACRLGVYLGVEPEAVYLHAGTADGAKALGLGTSRGYLEMDELPAPFRLLEPWECEDFLCIYKSRLTVLSRPPSMHALS